MFSHLTTVCAFTEFCRYLVSVYPSPTGDKPGDRLRTLCPPPQSSLQGDLDSDENDVAPQVFPQVEQVVLEVAPWVDARAKVALQVLPRVDSRVQVASRVISRVPALPAESLPVGRPMKAYWKGRNEVYSGWIKRVAASP
jgi:hypothetical protein